MTSWATTFASPVYAVTDWATGNIITASKLNTMQDKPLDMLNLAVLEGRNTERHHDNSTKPDDSSDGVIWSDSANSVFKGMQAGDAVTWQTFAMLETAQTFTAAIAFSSTVDINSGAIDGTAIGGSTPAAGAFTTLSASGALTATGGIGVGTTDLETWHATYNTRTIQIGTTGAIAASNAAAGSAFFHYVQGAYFSGGGTWKHKDATTKASAYVLNNGQHIWRYAANGTEDADFTWTEQMRLDTAGNLTVATGGIINTAIGATSPSTGAFTTLSATGDLTFIGDGSGLPYGGMYQDEVPTTISVTAAAVPYVVTGMSTGQVNAVTFQNAKELLIANAGRWHITWSCSFKCTPAGNNNIEGAIGIDDAPQTNGTAHRYISTPTDTGAMGGNAILDLAASKRVSIMLTNETDADDIIVEHASLSAVMVGGT
jgi:hypothetical protein